MRITIELEGERFDLDLQRQPDAIRVESEDAHLELKGHTADAAVQLSTKDEAWRVELLDDHRATINGRPIRYFVDAFAPGAPLTAAGTQARIAVRAVMHGRLVKALVQAGQSVRRGDALFIIEAMKMQNELASPDEGLVAEVVAKPGDVVDVGRVLAWLERRKA